MCRRGSHNPRLTLTKTHIFWSIRMKIPCAVETKTMILVNDDDKTSGGRNVEDVITEKQQPLPSSVSVTSLLADKEEEEEEETHCYDDIICSSSASILQSSCSLLDTECSESVITSSTSEFGKSSLLQKTDVILSSSPSSSSSSSSSFSSFTILRLKYLSVLLVIMLADGLQGTHLYVLYESYGFNVASLYALGFVTGAVTTPITGPLIDKFGRKRSAMLYCILEIGINLLEQYPFLSGLLVSRMVGGITTNLLSSVFETWLDTEYRNQRNNSRSNASSATATTNTTTTTTAIDDDNTTSSTSVISEWSKVTTYTDYDDDREVELEVEDTIAKNEYELIMRDSVVVSNLASIASGYLAHVLAEKNGPVGPFQGAVTCTGIALVTVSLLWTENYGVSSASFYDEKYEEIVEENDDNDGKFRQREHHSDEQMKAPSSKSIREYVMEAMTAFRSDSKILCIGIIQGLSAGSLQIFIFLWSPTLQKFASVSNINDADGQVSYFPFFGWAMDGSGEPAYGLIFGSFMAAGVTGGLCASYFRQAISLLFSPKNGSSSLQTVHIEAEGINIRPMALEFLVGVNYIISAILLFIPCILSTKSPESFSIALASFLAYEFLVGVTMPNEGVIRSIYLPSSGRATMMMVPRMIVNLAVSLGVLLTKYMASQSAFVAIAVLMGCTGCLQLSFMSHQEWTMIRRQSIQHARSLSITATKLVWPLEKSNKLKIT